MIESAENENVEEDPWSDILRYWLVCEDVRETLFDQVLLTPTNDSCEVARVDYIHRN